VADKVEVDVEISNRDLDAEVAAKVMRLPNVGWYKRKSCYVRTWVPATGSDDFTEDHPA